MRKNILVMDDEVSTAITAPGAMVLRDQAHGAEMEEDSVEAEEATFSTTFWQQMDRQNATPQGTRSKREDSDVQSHLSDCLEDR